MESEANDLLLHAVRERRSAQQKRTEFGYGILTADKYVTDMQDCVGLQQCYKLATVGRTSFGDAMLKATKTLVYSSPDMEVLGEPEWDQKAAEVEGIEWPKNMLMKFTHVLTTPRKDRDGDVLRTEGAMVDPKMPLLWQHVHTLPIGKMVYVVEHNAKRLVVCSALIDINDLAHDAAVMVDNGMARFSHGFRALEFAQLKEAETDPTGSMGFDVKRFEIMEESIVSVPSNVDAEVLEKTLSLVEGGKLKSGVMKAVGRQLRASAPVMVASGWESPPKSAEAKSDWIIKDNRYETGPSPNSITLGSGGVSVTAQKAGDAGSASEKADGDGRQDAPAENAADAEGVTEKGVANSWEEVTEKLNEQAASYLLGMGVNINDDCWLYVAATFDDHAIVCVYGCGPAKPQNYNISWQSGDDGPKFVGEPTLVDLVTTTEVVERSAMTESKAGRKLSRATMQALKECADDMDELMKEHCTTRASKALCERCSGRIKGLLSLGVNPDDDDVGDDDEAKEAAELDVKSIFAAALSLSDSQRSLLGSVLSTVDHAEKTNDTFHSLQNLIN